MRTIKYDPTIIHTFARQLYHRAFLVVAGYTIAAAALPAAVVFIGGTLLAQDVERGPGIGDALLFGVAGGLVGFLIGRQRAFWFKLQAQTALCQAQIEANTRNLAYVLGTPVSPPMRPAVDAEAVTVRAESA